MITDDPLKMSDHLRQTENRGLSPTVRDMSLRQSNAKELISLYAGPPQSVKDENLLKNDDEAFFEMGFTQLDESTTSALEPEEEAK